MKTILSAGRCAVAFAVCAALNGCATPGWLAGSGPSNSQVTAVNQQLEAAPVRLLSVDAAATQRLAVLQKRELFSEALAGAGEPAINFGNIVGPGDVISISVWEAPPATLFTTAGPGGSSISDSSSSGSSSRSGTTMETGVTGSHSASVPEQMVAPDGTIDVPFAGKILVAGKSPQQIDADIAGRLEGKAHQPQVIAQVVHNNSESVTVIGEVTQSQRVPLTAKGERLLDAIAVTGGVRQPLSRVMVQVTRGSQVLALPLDTVIRSPKENVLLAPGDVITILFQPLSFTALGATGKNDEYQFEAQGISLAQALARAGGPNDTLADARGVFLFRFEDPRVVPADGRPVPTTPDGRVPVIYRMNLRDPVSFLVAQNFPVRDKDVLYIANAPSADLQKFLTIIVNAVYSITNIKNL